MESSSDLLLLLGELALMFNTILGWGFEYFRGRSYLYLFATTFGKWPSRVYQVGQDMKECANEEKILQSFVSAAQGVEGNINYLKHNEYRKRRQHPVSASRKSCIILEQSHQPFLPCM
jgi:hypothetical protein